MAQAPLRIGKVVLTVHDLAGVRDFYQNVVGLGLISDDAESAALGVDGQTLLELRRDRAARRSSPHEAGLFHTAFLLPTRSDLARWVALAAERSIQLEGASDHIVSEALYLTDPEGNGIEIYVDRPAESWKWSNGTVKMATDRLNFPDLMAQAGSERWNGAPSGTTVGHVHLRVGALEPAEAFYSGLVGMDVTNHYPGATFYSTGGYHHHLATNIWNSRGAGVRQQPATGLSEVRLLASQKDVVEAMAARTGVAVSDGQIALEDPWGTSISVGVS